MIFPWQQDQLKHLWRAKQENRLPHALLFAGISGIGKAVFADNFTRALLCSRTDANGMPCNECHSCRLIEGRAHPNVMLIEPEKEGGTIKIDQIREVSDFINQSSMQGEYRVVVINPANSMNVNSANALLKTLEEPSSGAIMVLISDQNERLPATILSRCQRVAFARPAAMQGLEWLKSKLTDNNVDPELLLNLANGAPLAALRLVEDKILAARQELLQGLYSLIQQQDDPVKVAAKLKDIEPLRVLDFTLSWVTDVLRLQLGDDTIINKDFAKQLDGMKQKTDIKNNTKFMDYLQQLRTQVCAGINLNKQLMIEAMLIRYRGVA